MKAFFVALILSAVAGFGYADVPKCTGQKNCEAMWLDAQENIQMATGMRLRLSTPDRLETFAARSPYFVGVVTKYPAGDDAYEIRGSIECRREGSCGDIPATAIRFFNLALNNAADRRAQQ